MTRRVMLIEDEPNISEALRFILTRGGYEVSTLADGTLAEAAILDQRPDVLILDVMLPGRSGFDILASLRARGETADLPVLMLTAKGQDRDRQAAEQLGASGFMAKPFSNTEILAQVRAMVGP